MHPLMRRALATGSILFLFSSALPALAQVGGCGNLDALTDVNRRIAQNISTAARSDFGSFTCQNVGTVDGPLRSQRCLAGLCAGDANVMCCAPGTGGRAGTAGACVDDPEAGVTCPTVTGGGGGGFMRLELPACIETGNCSLDDIIQTGVNFANFLFGISGAILLATFVYGGVLYLTAGSGENVSKAKDMLKNALIGMVLVFGAGLLVSTIYDTFRSDSAGGGDTCSQSKPGFSCQYLSAPASDATALQAEMTSRRCVPSLCAGDATRVCCPETGIAP